MFGKIMLIAMFISVFCFSSVTSAQEINITQTGTVPSHQVKAVAEAVTKTVHYMSTNFGRQLKKSVVDISVVTENEANTLQSKQTNDVKVGGESVGNHITLIIPKNATNEYITFLTAHELTHQYQMECSGGTKAMNRNMWFTEGMADYIGMRVASEDSPDVYERRLNAQKRNVRNHPISLREITDKQGWSDAFYSQEKTYAKADLAIDHLNSVFGDRMMFIYLENLSVNSAEKSVRDSYGMSIFELDLIVSRELAKD